MTTPTIDVLGVRKRTAESHFLRETLQVILHTVMDPGMAAQIGAELYEHTPERVAYGNGYRPHRCGMNALSSSSRSWR